MYKRQDEAVFERVTQEPMQLAVYSQKAGTNLQLQTTQSSPRRGSAQNGRREPARFEFEANAERCENVEYEMDSAMCEESVKRDVTESLNAAWQLPETERRKVIRRLLLRWHPDKNIDDQDFATSITQHIHTELDRLEGKTVPDDELPEGYYADPRNPFAGSESFQRNFASAFRFFFEQMNNRAREHKTQRERYRENFAREYANTSASFHAAGSNIPPPSFASCNPQPAQARRFLRQAQEDLRSAGHDLDAEEPSYEWVTFKVYQVCLPSPHVCFFLSEYSVRIGNNMSY